MLPSRIEQNDNPSISSLRSKKMQASGHAGQEIIKKSPNWGWKSATACIQGPRMHQACQES